MRELFHFEKGTGWFVHMQEDREYKQLWHLESLNKSATPQLGSTEATVTTHEQLLWPTNSRVRSKPLRNMLLADLEV